MTLQTLIELLQEYAEYHHGDTEILIDRFDPLIDDFTTVEATGVFYSNDDRSIHIV